MQLMANVGPAAFPLPASGERDRVRGRCQFRQEQFEDAVEIAKHLVVPNADDLITELRKALVSMLVGDAAHVLAAVHLDNELPFAADEIDVESIDRLLPANLKPPRRRSRNTSHNTISAFVLRFRSERARLVARSFGPRINVSPAPVAPHPGPLPAGGERESAAPFAPWPATMSAACPGMASPVRRRGRRAARWRRGSACRRSGMTAAGRHRYDRNKPTSPASR